MLSCRYNPVVSEPLEGQGELIAFICSNAAAWAQILHLILTWGEVESFKDDGLCS